MKRDFYKTSGSGYSFKVVFLSIAVLLGAFGHAVRKKEILNALTTRQESLPGIVVLNNQQGIIPLKQLASKKVATVNIGNANVEAFIKMLANYAQVQPFQYSGLNETDLQPYSTIIIQVASSALYSADVMSFISRLSQSNEVVIAGFGQSTALQRLDQFITPIVWNPEQSNFAAQHSAQVIFGGEAVNNKLTSSISLKYTEGAGFITQKTRLSYLSASNSGISLSKLERIDRIMDEAIDNHATPGAVVMVVKNGNVVFNKAYGYHTYAAEEPTQVDDIFDLASVTKIASTTMAAMKLVDEKKISMDAGLGYYLPELQGSNKEFIPLREVMLHQAGLINLDFLSYVRPQDHSTDSSFFFPIKITGNYFLRRDFYRDVMLPKMIKTALPTKGQYVYSDLSMFMMKEVVEHQSGQTLDKYVQQNFYQPLGMKTAGYLPLNRFHKEKIVPTERDGYFRRTLLQGYVHDSGAALANGVSGHAGLFASANDMAILNQMLLDGGNYGGENYLNPETIHLFTSKQSQVSRRGLGFDRSNGSGYPSSSASTETFGHTGYTGTCVWVDPKENLIYIFLSNRVYPNASTKLNSLRIRPRIQDVIYEAIAEGRRDYADNSAQ